MEHSAKLYKKLSNNQVLCTACYHFCKIKNKKTGICGVRQNNNGELILLVFNKSMGCNIDPIEKKPLYHFYPGENVLSFGTAGCNFQCAFCQNWQISQGIRGKNILKYGEFLTPELIINKCLQQNIKIIAATYNEPTVFTEYAMETFKLAKQHNIKTVFVSNGYQSNIFWNEYTNLIDAINIDLKGFSSDFYKNIIKAKLNNILKNIQYIATKTKIWLEITTLIIPGINDDPEEIINIANFIVKVSPDIPWHVTVFHPNHKMLDIKSTSSQKMLQAYEIGKKAGLKFVYIGNIHIKDKGNTFCPKCNNTLIERFGFSNNKLGLIGDKCSNCNQIIPGIWS